MTPCHRVPPCWWPEPKQHTRVDAILEGQPPRGRMDALSVILAALHFCTSYINCTIPERYILCDDSLNSFCFVIDGSKAMPLPSKTGMMATSTASTSPISSIE